MSFITKIFSGGIEKTIDAAGKIVDNVSTTDEEKIKLKNELATVINDGFKSFAETTRQIALAEANGNWLQRSWRPILLLSFGLILLVSYSVLPMLGKSIVPFPDEFWMFLNIIVPTTVVARTYEKVSGAFSKNVDISMINKKERGAAFEKNETK